MDTRISRFVAASPQVMFRLAAQVEEWPRLLPHYRSVRLSDGLVEMAAYRPVVGNVGIPLWWVATRTLYPHELRMEFRHVRGITRGMWVEWVIAASAHGCVVSIRHVFWPHWPVPDGLVRAIVGEYFVNGVARRTLACLSARAQRPS